MYVPPILRQGRAPPDQGPFRGITVTVIATMLASVSVYLRTWASYDRLSDSLGNTAYSIFSTEKDHFDFIIGWELSFTGNTSTFISHQPSIKWLSKYYLLF